MKSFFIFLPSVYLPRDTIATMTTYNESQFSATRITTDLELYFELTQNVYSQDPEFAERWNEYIIDMVKDRLWSYSTAVMTTELGNRTYEGTIDNKGDDEYGENTLREAFIAFAKSNREDDEARPLIWESEGGHWVGEEEVSGEEGLACDDDDDE